MSDSESTTSDDVDDPAFREAQLRFVGRRLSFSVRSLSRFKAKLESGPSALARASTNESPEAERELGEALLDPELGFESLGLFWNLQRACMVTKDLTDCRNLESRLRELEERYPDLKALRNIYEHWDDYVKGEGRYQKCGGPTFSGGERMPKRGYPFITGTIQGRVFRFNSGQVSVRLNLASVLDDHMEVARCAASCLGLELES